jgi:hypothetical protein
MKLPYKERAYDPSTELQTNLRAAVKQFIADFDGSSEIEHGPTKGEAREIPVQDFFRKRLPTTFRVDKGSVVDLCGNTSPAADVLISDQVRGFPLRDGASVTLAAEALLATVEVKSCLNSGEIESIFGKAEKFKALQPFRKPLAQRRTGGKEAGDGDRIFYCVFAYDSDLTNEDWASREYTRLTRISEKLNIPLSVIDRVYVLSRGLLISDERSGLEETEMPGSGLLQYYMHILNFLMRENGRRDDVPYLDYAGRMTKGWQKFGAAKDTQNT